MEAPERKDELHLMVDEYRDAYASESKSLAYAIIIAMLLVGSVLAVVFQVF